MVVIYFFLATRGCVPCILELFLKLEWVWGGWHRMAKDNNFDRIDITCYAGPEGREAFIRFFHVFFKYKNPENLQLNSVCLHSNIQFNYQCMILTRTNHSMHMKMRAEPALLNQIKYNPKSILIFYFIKIKEMAFLRINS